MFSALLNTEAHRRFARIEGYGIEFDVPVGQADYAQLHALPEPLRGRVLEAFAASFRVS